MVRLQGGGRLAEAKLARFGGRGLQVPCCFFCDGRVG